MGIVQPVMDDVEVATDGGDGSSDDGEAARSQGAGLGTQSSACVHAVAAHSGQSRQMPQKKGCQHARGEDPGLELRTLKGREGRHGRTANCLVNSDRPTLLYF